MVDATRQLEEVLRRRRVMDMSSMRKSLRGRSRRSLFRDLNLMGSVASFTHAGRYHTLPALASFDERGLWFFQGIGFSRAGTLKTTMVELVNHSADGHTHRELVALIRVRVHNTLLELVRQRRIGREFLEKMYLYVSAESVRAAEQLSRRKELLAGEVKPPPIPQTAVIEILLEVVRVGRVWVAPSVVVKRLSARDVGVTKEQVEQVFSSYGLGDEKKTAVSRSKRSRH